MISLIKAGLGRDSSLTQDTAILSFTKKELILWMEYNFESQNWKDFFTTNGLSTEFEKGVGENKIEAAIAILLKAEYNPATGQYGKSNLNIQDFNVIENRKRSIPSHLTSEFSANSNLKLKHSNFTSEEIELLENIRCLNLLLNQRFKQNSLLLKLLSGKLNEWYLFNDENINKLLLFLRHKLLQESMLEPMTKKPLITLKRILNELTESKDRSPREILLRAYEIKSSKDSTRLDFLNKVLELALKAYEENRSIQKLPINFPHEKLSELSLETSTKVPRPHNSNGERFTLTL